MKKLLDFFKYHWLLLAFWIPVLLPHIFGWWPYVDWSSVRFKEVTANKITLGSVVNGVDAAFSNLMPAFLFLGFVMVIWGIGAYLYQRFWLSKEKCYFTIYTTYGLAFLVIISIFSYGISYLDETLSNIVVDKFSSFFLS